MIALVITIVVLLILAGVSIAMLTGNNGILNQASASQEEINRLGAKEEIQLETTGSFDDEGNYKVEIAVNNLKENLKIPESDIIQTNGVLKVKYKGYEFYVGLKGKVTEGLTSDILAGNATEYFGRGVTNYECENDEGVTSWLIFYADDSNIYLIISNILDYNYAPEGKLGTTMVQSKGVSEVYKDYTGSEDILANEKTANLLSYAREYPESNLSAIRAAAYLLDTEAWGKRFNGEKAEYAIGGPTIDMFLASHNKKYPDNKVEYMINQNGYYNKEGNNYITGITRDSLYTKSYFYVTGLSNRLPTTNDGRGYIPDRGFNWCNTFRPVVCLKSDVELEQLEDGNFKIK